MALLLVVVGYQQQGPVVIAGGGFCHACLRQGIKKAGGPDLALRLPTCGDCSPLSGNGAQISRALRRRRARASAARWLRG